MLVVLTTNKHPKEIYSCREFQFILASARMYVRRSRSDRSENLHQQKRRKKEAT
jgi:hypothetical protein